MVYSVLTMDSSIATFLDSTKGLSGVYQVLVSVHNAMEWLNTNPDGNLIISMPLDQQNRQIITDTLGEFDARCIALDPPLLLSESRIIFSKTITAATALLKQIKGITTGTEIL